MKHLTVRFAWHDNKWNGKVCKKPSENIYCIDNYSLLSSRLQRRKRDEIEEKYASKSISLVKNKTKYIPPCYWCINALGDKEYKVSDLHPFADFEETEKGKDFKKVPPLKYTLRPFSVFTWNFKLSFENREKTKYRYPPDLEERVKKFIKKIKPKKSIGFFYANYGNPITGDERKYLLLGAGLIEESVEFPKKFKIPSSIYEKYNKDYPVFPRISWQLQVSFNPDLTFILPYHEYLEYVNRDEGLEKPEREKLLDEISVKIEDQTIIPHFKYVSMHLPHDKAIYLLYKLRLAIAKMRQHNIINTKQIEVLEKKISKLLKIAWNNRGAYPGFKNLLKAKLENDFSEDKLDIFAEKTESVIKKQFKSLDNFFNKKNNISKLDKIDPEIKKILRKIAREFSLYKYLSRFDFSILQFKNVIKLIDEIGPQQFGRNPYILLEKYPFDAECEDWNIEKMDTGISIYHIDIPLIPDLAYVKWDTSFDAESPERIRALITKILKISTQEEGNTYLYREEILKRLRAYPLFYIQNKFELDQMLLSNYESEPRFKETFNIVRVNYNGKTLYQLKCLANLEKHIERFIISLLKKHYNPEISSIKYLANNDVKKFSSNLNLNPIRQTFRLERFELYKKTLGNGLTVVTGKAGTGKTTAIVNLVKNSMNRKEFPIFIFTPTGKANLVIRKRLRDTKVRLSSDVIISTIHRFIFRELREKVDRKSFRNMTRLIERILEGHYEQLEKFFKETKRIQFNPKVVIIDEASMADELILGLLLALLNPASIRYLIIMGDDKQLPPIGIGRPFVDLIFYLKNKRLDDKHYIHLETNLRFPSNKVLENFSQLFRGKEPPLQNELEEILYASDDTFKLLYYKDLNDFQKILVSLLSRHFKITKNTRLKEMFKNIFEENNNLIDNLGKIQILTPKRIGKFGSSAINLNVILGGERNFKNTKIICGQNQYWNIGKSGRTLGLANGSIGYSRYKKKYYIKFADIDELFELYDNDKEAEKNIKNNIKKITKELGNFSEQELPFSHAYAITIHKSQGSDFEYVILVLSEPTRFFTKELFYTGLTRARKKTYLLVHNKLKAVLNDIFIKAYENSQTDTIHTLLFGHKISPSKPYEITLQDGKRIWLRSKIEYIIAKTLNELEVDFEYEPEDFRLLKPDFKILIGDNWFYWEHLGILDQEMYKKRWYEKLDFYEKENVLDILITTSENQERPHNIEKKIKKIIHDIVSNNIKFTEGSYSKHHYEI